MSQYLCHKLFLGIPHPQISKIVPINMGPKMNRFRDIDLRSCAGTLLSISLSPTIPAQTFIGNVVWCLASRMACGCACARICTLRKLKFPSHVNIASSVNNSSMFLVNHSISRISSQQWISLNLFTFRPMLIGTFLLIWGLGMPRKICDIGFETRDMSPSCQRNKLP